MLKALKRLARSVLLGVRRDPVTGHLYYRVEGTRVHLRFADECIRPQYRDASFREIYFKHYLPTGSDCVVDFGAGLGTEIVMLAARSPDLRYIAVEIQPWVYECLCLTLAQLPAGFEPYGLAVGEGGRVRIAPARAGEDASTLAGGPIPVESLTWREFASRHRIQRVDLLKMNVEGAEAALLDQIDLSQIQRAIVSFHDFRADRGEGEHYRTRARVEARLRTAGFALTPVGDSWMFAERLLD